MAKKNKALGKGLGAIISTSPTPAETLEKTVIETSTDKVIEIPLKDIQVNPHQPRLTFDEEEIEGLAASIKSVGLIQPVIVRKRDRGYYLVAGERRFRAVKLNNMVSIKAIVIEADEEKNLTIALIENIQRKDLDPIEEAKAYRLLVENFNLKQMELAQKVGKERATVANVMRLLNLSEEIQEGISAGLISMGHAKVLLSVNQKKKQLQLYKTCLKEELSVRALENLLKDKGEEPEEEEEKKTEKKKEAHIRKLERKLEAQLGTKVEIHNNAKNKGKIEINYYSLDDFDRIMGLISDE